MLYNDFVSAFYHENFIVFMFIIIDMIMINEVELQGVS